MNKRERIDEISTKTGLTKRLSLFLKTQLEGLYYEQHINS